jgi:CheY-like chemotaxis protein
VARAHPTLREGVHVLLSVRDSGAGMDETTRARAFEPFFTTKPTGEGTGLGLALVHGIVRDHGGAVWLESVEGQGTTVTCALPAIEVEPAQEVAGEAAGVARGAGERVLLVDDEPALAELGQRRLKNLGYRAVSVTDPAVALELLRSGPDQFDLLVTDFSMPKRNGLELARAVMAIRSDLPVLLLSGYMEEFPDADLAAAGIRRVLKKPLTTAELGQALRAVLHPS